MEGHEGGKPRAAGDPGGLEARRIGRRAPRSEGWLLREASLKIGRGERIALIGPSGSGKTLLLRALALLDPLDAGEIRWNGQVVSRDAVPRFRSRVTYLPQRPTCFPGTVEQNLQQPFSLAVHRDRAFDKKRILALLRQTGRDAEFLAKSSRILSGGERQLLAVLRVLQMEPVLLLLDEPTAALDADTAVRVGELIRTWQAEQRSNRGFLWVTHQAELVEQFADRMFIMREGGLIEGRP